LIENIFTYELYIRIYSFGPWLRVTVGWTISGFNIFTKGHGLGLQSHVP